MLSFLPWYYQDSKIMQSILNAQGIEIDSTRYTIEDILKQFYVDTATWGLSLWEKDLDIKDIASNYDERRRKIKLYLMKPTSVTPEFLERLANNYIADSSAKVIEHNNEYRFDIVMNGNQFIDLDSISKAIDLYKPAHLGYGYIKETNIEQNIFIGGIPSIFREYTISPKLLRNISTKGIEYVNAKAGQHKDFTIKVAGILSKIDTQYDKNISLISNTYKEYTVRPKNISDIKDTHKQYYGVSFYNYKEIHIGIKEENNERVATINFNS